MGDVKLAVGLDRNFLANRFHSWVVGDLKAEWAVFINASGSRAMAVAGHERGC
jgi:hypothetical protein